MDEITEVRRKLQQSLSRKLPDDIWEDEDIRGIAKEYLNPGSGGDRNESWSLLKEVTSKRLGLWDKAWDKAKKVGWEEGRKEGLRGIESGTRGGSREMREAASRDTGEMENLDAGLDFDHRTQAMVGAMKMLFASLADQIPEVKEFREEVLPGRFLTADEAHSLIASEAARIFDLRLFEKWNIPVIGHKSALVERDTRSDRGGIYARATVRVDPPGITKTVRYVDAYNSLKEEDVAATRASAQGDAVIPIHRHFPIEWHGDHTYPSWLWPGSVVDKLYDLSVELASTFDWPLPSVGNLSGTRPRSESAAWFVLTGEAPQVRPIDARWEEKHGSTYLSPQWRIQLTIPPWLSEKEVLQAFRTLRRQRPKGRQMPKTAKPLEVARFVWERERHDGYREPAPWTAWLKQWNKKHSGHRIETASNFRTYFIRGAAAVTHLNFDWPDFEHHEPDTTGNAIRRNAGQSGEEKAP
jgi:hypothetical protein